jgi:hypothetical protein
MSGWFDSVAKRSARAQASSGAGRGLTRRQVVRGAAIGVAWTAPMIVATSAPAWAVASEGNLGGSCGNQGQGTCNSPYHCNGNLNQCNTCFDPNICGGEGAQCCNNSECVPGTVCTLQTTTGDSFCRRTCTGGPGQGSCQTGQNCIGGLCAKACVTNAGCLGSAVCIGAPVGTCSYQKDGNFTCP